LEKAASHVRGQGSVAQNQRAVQGKTMRAGK
jgi:hypothetical protein